MEICILEDENEIPYMELVNLLHMAFEQRTEEGLLFSCRNFSLEELKEHTSGGIFIIAKEANEVVGMVVMLHKKRYNIEYTTLEYLAVSPIHTNRGIASLLISSFINLAKDNGCDFIIASTASIATSSIRAHLKNGFKKFLVVSFSQTNYFSCCFIYPIKRFRIFNSSLFCTFTYSLSSFYTKLFKKK